MVAGNLLDHDPYPEELVDLRGVWCRAVELGRIQSVMNIGERQLRFGLRCKQMDTVVVEQFIAEEDTGIDLESVAVVDEDECNDDSTSGQLYMVGLHPGFRQIYAKYDVSIVTRRESVLKLNTTDTVAHRQRPELPHEEDKCSICSGPNRLPLRPLLARLQTLEGRVWDVHFNISPLHPSGHLLVVPDMRHTTSRRRQELLRTDVLDFVALAQRALPAACRGGGVLVFNSIGGGASQNHIHAHVFLKSFPVLSLLCETGGLSKESNALVGDILDARDGVKVDLLSGHHREHVGNTAVCHCACLRISWTSLSPESLNTAAEHAWAVIGRLNATSQAFNLVVHGSSFLIIPRTRAFTVDARHHLGACHYAGLFLVNDAKALQCIRSIHDICRILSDCSATAEELRSLWMAAAHERDNNIG